MLVFGVVSVCLDLTTTHKKKWFHGFMEPQLIITIWWGVWYLNMEFVTIIIVYLWIFRKCIFIKSISFFYIDRWCKKLLSFFNVFDWTSNYPVFVFLWLLTKFFFPFMKKQNSASKNLVKTKPNSASKNIFSL